MSKFNRPRMSDIAREANVNRITVSRALSNPELVAPNTLARINAAIAKTGYVPNQIARVMKSASSRIVSLVTPMRMSGVYGAMVERLSEELFKGGLIVNLYPIHHKEGYQEEIIREIAGWHPSTVVTFGFQMTETSISILSNAGTSLVRLLDYREDNEYGSCVGYDQRYASQILTEHLLDRGYRKICYVHTGQPKNTIATERLAGFVDAIRSRGGQLRLRQTPDQTGLDDPENAILGRDLCSGIEIQSEAAFHNGFGLMGQLVSWQERPDAVLCASDLVAVGALQYCLANNLEPAREIGLCAFDGIELTSVMQPHLTCLDFPHRRVIAEGSKHILRLARNQDDDHARVRLDVKVLHRQST